MQREKEEREAEEAIEMSNMYQRELASRVPIRNVDQFMNDQIIFEQKKVAKLKLLQNY